jgi:hypothetical protein
MGSDVSDPERDFYVTYGRTMASWAMLEMSLYLLFLRLTGMRRPMGMAVFYSARSFLGRSEMVSACIDHVRDIPAAKAFLRGAIGRANSYAMARNRLAHDHHDWFWSPGRKPPDPHEVRITRLTTGEQMTEMEIDEAAHNFTQLGALITDSIGADRVVKAP